jgi:hypothetical protein
MTDPTPSLSGIDAFLRVPQQTWNPKKGGVPEEKEEPAGALRWISSEDRNALQTMIHRARLQLTPPFHCKPYLNIKAEHVPTECRRIKLARSRDTVYFQVEDEEVWRHGEQGGEKRERDIFRLRHHTPFERSGVDEPWTGPEAPDDGFGRIRKFWSWRPAPETAVSTKKRKSSSTVWSAVSMRYAQKVETADYESLLDTVLRRWVTATADREAVVRCVSHADVKVQKHVSLFGGHGNGADWMCTFVQAMDFPAGTLEWRDLLFVLHCIEDDGVDEPFLDRVTAFLQHKYGRPRVRCRVERELDESKPAGSERHLCVLYARSNPEEEVDDRPECVTQPDVYGSDSD